MPTITRFFKIYLYDGISAAPNIHVSQDDSEEIWYFDVFDENGAPYIPQTASLIGKKPDGHTIAVPAEIVDGKVKVIQTEQMTAAAGRSCYELHLDNNHGTANFTVMVEEDPAEGGIASDSDLSLFRQVVDNADRIALYGSPLKAELVSQMTSLSSVYVYTGSEAGMNPGHWYTWNGSAWEDGGVYNAVAVNTDKTMTLNNVPADAAAVGAYGLTVINGVLNQIFEED